MSDSQYRPRRSVASRYPITARLVCRCALGFAFPRRRRTPCSPATDFRGSAADVRRLWQGSRSGSGCGAASHGARDGQTQRRANEEPGHARTVAGQFPGAAGHGFPRPAESPSGHGPRSHDEQARQRVRPGCFRYQQAADKRSRTEGPSAISRKSEDGTADAKEGGRVLGQRSRNGPTDRAEEERQIQFELSRDVRQVSGSIPSGGPGDVLRGRPRSAIAAAPATLPITGASEDSRK